MRTTGTADMAAQPAITYDLDSPIDAVDLASFASGAAGVTVEVIRHPSHLGESWSLRTATVSPDVEIHLRGEELLIAFWPEHPDEYFFSLVEAFVLSKGAKPRDQGAQELRNARRRAKLASRTWQEHCHHTSARGRILKAVIVGVLAVVLVGYLVR